MNNQFEKKVCQNCKVEFFIEADDFAFYEKMKTPPPTWCSECRLQRKLMFRNERILSKRTCGLCGKGIITMYAPEAEVPVYCQNCWWGDDWSPLEYGVEYDFSRPFFGQLGNLMKKVPLANLNNLNATNSDYCNYTYHSKNCYLNFASDENEDTGYLYHTIDTKNSYDSTGCKNLNLCYEGFYSRHNYSCKYTFFSENCMNSAFLFDCTNCQNCFGCAGLRNVHHYIFNKPFSEEEYKEEMKKYDLGDYEAVRAITKKFDEFVLSVPHRYAENFKTVNSTGDYLSNTKDCTECFDMEGPIENSKRIIYSIPDVKDSMDIYGTGAGVELCYEAMGCGLKLQNTAFSIAYEGHSNRYAFFCRGSNNCFGCIGVRNKEYCILNKQYSKEEYEELLPKVIEHMNTMPYVDKKRRTYAYGEFPPGELSPHAYNETIAQEFFPLTKAEVENEGYLWRDSADKNYSVTRKPEDLPMRIDEADDDILNEVIGCIHEGKCMEQCATAFKLTKEEFEFYRRMRIPLPRLCPNCRHYERLKRRNPFKLWHRSCQCVGEKSEGGTYTNTGSHPHGAGKCPNEFETTFAPDRPEIVYCEQCYRAEIV